MNCQSFETVVNDLARAQMMEASVRDDALLHSSECQRCAARLENERDLTRTLHEFSVKSRTASLGQGIENALVAEFQRHQRSRTTCAATSRRRYPIYAAAAAALVIAFTAIIYRAVVADDPPHNVVVAPPANNSGTNAIKAATPSPEQTLPDNNVQESQLMAKKPVRRPRSRVVRTVNNSETVAANHASPEITSDFIPIGYSSAVSVEEGGQLVRIEMPRSAMARFGVPVNMERYNERVKADVLVSADGLARAIRFVQ